MTFNLTEINNLCSSEERVPLKYRNTYDNAKSFINFIISNNIKIHNKYVIQLKNALNKDMYSVVKSINYAGEQQTYDIEVENSHMYKANGIIVHNTCNLPNNATEQQISEIYLDGWKKNCKGITVYRDGCRSGVMVTQNDKQCKCETSLTHSAPKRPKTLPADIKRFKNGGDKWIAFVGLYHNQPYEIFTGLAEKVDIPEYVTTCDIVKNKVEKEVYNEETGLNEVKSVSSYDIMYTDKNGNKRAIFDVGNIFLTEFDGYGRMISGLLRTGMWPEYIVATLKHCKFTNETINSWKAGVIRAIKSYIKDGEVQGEVCPECGGKIVRENGCKHCINCGWSACQ